MPKTDNASASPDQTLSLSNAHGRAALLLVESLIHGLVEDSTLTAGRAVEIADRAVEIEFDQAEAAGDAGTHMWQSHGLLSIIATSLAIDDDRELSRSRSTE